MKLKAIFNIIKKYLHFHDFDLFMVFGIIGALFLSFIAFKAFKPVNFTDGEIENYTVIAETVWNNGLKDIDSKDANYSISIVLPAEITVSSKEPGKGDIKFDFSKKSLYTTIENEKISDWILTLIVFLIIGYGFGGIIFICLYIIWCIISAIIKFIWRTFVKIHDSYVEELERLEYSKK